MSCLDAPFVSDLLRVSVFAEERPLQDNIVPPGRPTSVSVLLIIIVVDQPLYSLSCAVQYEPPAESVYCAVLWLVMKMKNLKN